MGTLTADSARLPEYCEHKLPTSCRLTSIPNCCACADERAHAASYSTYIDGVGFVSRGTRWQRYCWFCKEFWEQRVRNSGLRPGQTRIPEAPDQTEFLQRWYEFHQRFRIVETEDGTQERVAVLGEDFRDVSPGCLPRTLEEMRTGRRPAEEAQNVLQEISQPTVQAGPSLDDTLEQMFMAASAEAEENLRPMAATPNDVVPADSSAPPFLSNVHAQSMTPAGSRNREYQLRRVAALRRELSRMRTGIERVISGLRDLGEEVPNHTETTDRLTALGSALESITESPSQGQAAGAIHGVNALAASAGTRSSDRTLASMQARVDEARQQAEETRQARDQASVELDSAEERHRERQQRLQQLQREHRTTENYMRIFGTREEMIAMGDNYESPIGGMFTRAEARFRAAEDARVEERTLREVLAAEAAGDAGEETQNLLTLEAAPRDVWGVPLQMTSRPDRLAMTSVVENYEDLQEYMEAIRAESAPSEPDRQQARSTEERINLERLRRPAGDTTPPSLTLTGDEAMLQDYYALIREQDRRHQAPTPGPSQDTAEEAPTIEEWAANAASAGSFPPRMLNAAENFRARAVLQQHQQDREASRANISVSGTDTNQPRRHPIDLDAWWHRDAEHVLRSLAIDQNICRELDMTTEEASDLLSSVMNSMMSQDNRDRIGGLLRNPVVIWGMALPVEWLRRRKEERSNVNSAEELLFSASEGYMESWRELYNPLMRLEMCAQAYQMSGQVRRRAHSLSPPERLQLLYRLQAGERKAEDRAVLEEILRDSTSEHLAMLIYRTSMRTIDQDDAINVDRRQIVDNVRRQRANDGDHSRSELDSRRRETAQAFALAAGRQAMQTRPETLLQRVAAASDAARGAANDDSRAGTRAALRRLQNNNSLGRPPRMYRQLTLSDYLNEASSLSDSENEEDTEPRGLDALDTDRPEPKPDDELKIQMECKICYTQLAEVACLPCGHLVMCRWCSDQHSPCMQHDRTRPRRAAACPVCRKGIKQKVKIYRA